MKLLLLLCFMAHAGILSHAIVGGIGYEIGKGSSKPQVVPVIEKSDTCNVSIVEISLYGNPSYDESCGKIRLAKMSTPSGCSGSQEISVQYYTIDRWIKRIYPDRHICSYDMSLNNNYPRKATIIIRSK